VSQTFLLLLILARHHVLRAKYLSLTSKTLLYLYYRKLLVFKFIPNSFCHLKKGGKEEERKGKERREEKRRGEERRGEERREGEKRKQKRRKKKKR
jgi:hypothetical protein